ncbi:MAG TPA: FAD-binding oxidoreductase, partial [Candidatus Paceibacterota bacterium]|nr:FAD-binding oxidoreductase [Candidatus Paceibacterota bacterium]
MFENNSPWIKQLNRTRPIEPLDQNIDTEVVIIGGGIAGVTSAYFILTQTNKKVLLIEANKIAHGATGHNAGQITSYFEKPFTEIVAAYGLHRAAQAQRAIEEDARGLLEHIYSHAQLSTPRSEFMGYEGLATLAHVLEILQELAVKAEAGLRIRHLLVAREWDEHRLIPAQFAGLYSLVSQKNIFSLLETENNIYIAAAPFLSGCMNSALFSEELVGFLLITYKDRFMLREHTPVSAIALERDEVVLSAGTNTISCEQVLLCTNGFESVQITNNAGGDIDGKFHMTVEGVVGYMGAYKESLTKQPFAACYANPLYTTNREYY